MGARPGLPERAARLELRDDLAVHEWLPRVALDPHVFAFDEPVVAVLRRPDAHVQPQAVARHALLRARDPCLARSAHHAARPRALREPAGDPLPPAAAARGADPPRAGDRELQAGDGP